jgi:hypothetical protein
MPLLLLDIPEQKLSELSLRTFRVDLHGVGVMLHCSIIWVYIYWEHRFACGLSHHFLVCW